MNLTDTFVHTLYTLKSQPIPAEVKENARKCLLDQVGVMLAGAKLLRDQLEKYLDMFSGDDTLPPPTGLPHWRRWRWRSSFVPWR